MRCSPVVEVRGLDRAGQAATGAVGDDPVALESDQDSEVGIVEGHGRPIRRCEDPCPTRDLAARLDRQPRPGDIPGELRREGAAEPWIGRERWQDPSRRTAAVHGSQPHPEVGPARPIDTRLVDTGTRRVDRRAADDVTLVRDGPGAAASPHRSHAAATWRHHRCQPGRSARMAPPRTTRAAARRRASPECRRPPRRVAGRAALRPGRAAGRPGTTVRGAGPPAPTVPDPSSPRSGRPPGRHRRAAPMVDPPRRAWWMRSSPTAPRAITPGPSHRSHRVLHHVD